MKSAWVKATIDTVCQIRGGGTPSKAVSRYWNGDLPWVSPKDMKFQIVTDSIDHISEEATENSAASIIPEGAVLIVVRSGILARTVPIALAGRDLSINQDLKALCPNDTVLSKYLYYVLQSKMDELLSQVSRGATVHRLPTDRIRQLALLVPPVVEQRTIIAKLDEAMDALDSAEQATVRKVDLLKALRSTLLDEALHPS